MAKVLCPAVECIHYKDGRCTAKEVPLRQWQINTMYEGRKTMWECKSYEMSEEWKRIEKEIKRCFQRRKDGESIDEGMAGRQETV